MWVLSGSGGREEAGEWREAFDYSIPGYCLCMMRLQDCDQPKWIAYIFMAWATRSIEANIALRLCKKTPGALLSKLPSLYHLATAV